MLHLVINRSNDTIRKRLAHDTSEPGRSLSDAIILVIFSRRSCHGYDRTKRGCRWMIAQVILSILAGNDRKLSRLADTNERMRRQQMVLPPQIAIGELSWIYLYGSQAGNVPEEELMRRNRPDRARTSRDVRLLVILIPAPWIGLLRYSRFSRSRVSRMSFAERRHLIPTTGTEYCGYRKSIYRLLRTQELCLTVSVTV